MLSELHTERYLKCGRLDRVPSVAFRLLRTDIGPDDDHTDTPTTVSVDGLLFYLSSSSKLDLDSAEATEDGAYPIALRDLVLPGERP